MFEQMINARLALAKETFAKDKAHWEKEIKEVQESCLHEKIGETPGDYGNRRLKHGNRVCFQCGLTEIHREGRPFTKLTNPFVAQIENDDCRRHSIGPAYDPALQDFKIRG